MTSFEPPNGQVDLEAQAAEIQREREQMEAEHAEMMRQRQARKVVQGRADLDRRRAELAAELAALDEAETEGPIDSTAAGDVPEAEPDYTDADVWDVDPATGTAYLDEQGDPVPKWPYATVELKGRKVQVRPAKPTAVQALTLIAGKKTPTHVQIEAASDFCRMHLSARSFAELALAMVDPDDDFGTDDYRDLVAQIATLGTARPTQPSRG